MITKSSDTAFVVNDLHFTVGANAIQINKENMHYKYLALRETSTTKIPSGHGNCIINVKFQIPREDILRLHRLILEVKQNPFVYIENNIIRQTVVPNWASTQNMACTVLSLNINSVPGTVGLFECYLQMQWFNYFPYMKNFTFREDWESIWMEASGTSKYVKQSIYNYITQVNEGTPTVEDYMTPDKFMGSWHCLYGLPTNMTRSQEVFSPSDSYIYKRYFNVLQLRALSTNFGMNMMNSSNYEAIFSGNENLPDYFDSVGESEFIIENMMSKDYFKIDFYLYKTIDIPEGYKSALGANLNTFTQSTANILTAGTLPAATRNALLESQVINYARLYTQCNPIFKGYVDTILEKLVNGDTLSSKKYDNKQITISSVYRAATNSADKVGHSQTAMQNGVEVPSATCVDLTYTSVYWSNHFVLKEAGKNVLDKYKVSTDKTGWLFQLSVSFEPELRALHQEYMLMLMFYYDYSYCIQQTADWLEWGGNFRGTKRWDSGHGLEPEEVANAQEYFDLAWAYLKLYYASNNPGKTNPILETNEPRKLIYFEHDGQIGNDHVHLQGTRKAADMLAGNVPSYVTTSGIPVQEITAWFKALPHATDDTDSFNGFEDSILRLVDLGYKVWPDRAVNGVFYRPSYYILPTSSGIYRHNYQEHNENRDVIPGDNFYTFDTFPFKTSIADYNAMNLDGSSLDLDTVYTRCTGSLKHVVNAIPLASQQYPTHQHLGSLDNTFSFEFVTQNRNDRTALGRNAQIMNQIYENLLINGIELRYIYDSWMCKVDTFITRLMGSYQVMFDNLFNPLKQVLTNTSTYTIEGYPGLSGMNLSVEDSSPYIQEELVKVNQTSGKKLESIYELIVQNLKTRTHTTQYSARRTQLHDALSLNAAFPGSPIFSYARNPILGGTMNPLGEVIPAVDTFDANDSQQYPDYFTDENKKDCIQSIGRLGSLIELMNLIMVEVPPASKYFYVDYEELNLYGLESYFSPTMTKFVKHLLTQASALSLLLWANTIRELLEYLGQDIDELSVALLAIKDNIESLHLNTSPSIIDASVADIYNLFYYISTAYQVLIVLGNYEDIQDKLKPGGFDIAWFSIEFLVSTLYTAWMSQTPSYVNGSQQEMLYEALLNDPNMRRIIVAGVLVDIAKYFAGGAGLAFNAVTIGQLPAAFQDILGNNSILNISTYGLSETIINIAMAFFGENLDDSAYYRMLEKYPTFDPTKFRDSSKKTWELAKLKYIREQLEVEFNKILLDPILADFYGVTQAGIALYESNTADKRPLIKDMWLPAHPFYNSIVRTNPNFYYYDIHEDSDLFEIKELEKIYYNQMKFNIENVFQFNELNKKGAYNAATVAASLGVAAEELAPFFEGSDNPTSPEFNQFAQSNEALEKGITGKSFVTGDKLPLGTKKGGANFKASSFDDDILYIHPERTDLIRKIQDVEAQFGKKEGYANEREMIQEVHTGKPIHDIDTVAHFYDKETIQHIAEESVSDLLSQKRSMNRAFPTFRIYMIEEDQNEDFLMRFDDFYHYDAIKEITIVKSREVAADMAVIVMRNISGTLNGTRRFSISDTDYLSPQKDLMGNLTEKGKLIEEYRKKKNLETADEEKITSVVLRPGSNIQIRTGYGNDPELLEVKLSGRVVDVISSQNTDLIEVTVQSFAVELEQQPKGIFVNQKDVYNVTHRLLGSLMFSPELIHFGRFEKGIIPQFGEDKSSYLDFKTYEPFSEYTMHRHFKMRQDEFGFWTGAVVASAGGIDFLYQNLKNLYVESDFIVQHFTSATTWFSKRINNRYYSVITSPQDDNLFPPDPKDYLMRPNYNYYLLKNIVTIPASPILGIRRAASLIAQGFLSPRLKAEELTYIPNNNTIFQIFHEMTLRHPGYVYSPINYGKEFRYTMFFGVPSQRYWAGPAHPYLINQLNQTRKALNEILNVNEAVPAPGYIPTIRNTYAESVRIFMRPYSYFPIVAAVMPGFAAVGFYQTYLNPLVLPPSVATNPNPVVPQASNLKIKSEELGDVLSEYYKALTYRFKPFRRYHSAISDIDIIQNNISLSEYDVANAFAVNYYHANSGTDNQIQDTLLVKAHDAIAEDRIKLKSLDFENCRGSNMALRYGVGSLVYELKKAYDGSLLLLGNPRIKPWDIVMVYDHYNDMAGPIEVEQVIEKISFETGYITEIKPNMVVFANEISSFPILEGLKPLLGANLLKEQNITIPGQFDMKTFKNVKMDLIKKKIVDTTGFNLGNFEVNTADLPEDNYTGRLFQSGAWLLGGYLYMLSAARQYPLLVYPLLKNGLPWVAGFPPGMPTTMFAIFRGKINSILKETELGTIHFFDYWKELGIEAVDLGVKIATVSTTPAPP